MIIKKEKFDKEYQNKQIIKISNKDQTLFLYKYKIGLSDWSNNALKQSRGIVFDQFGNIVILPFEKFFNYHQYDWVNQELSEEDLLVLSNVKKDNIQYLSQLTQWPKNYNQIRVYDKLDGSMMNVSVYKDELICTSSGSIDGQYPELFKQSLISYLGNQLEEFKNMIKDKTLVFEYINSSLDTHVVLYNQPDLVLLGGFDHLTGHDLEFTNMLNQFANQFSFTKPHYYNDIKSKNDLLKLLEKLENENVEGCVVVFETSNDDKNHLRLKFKTQNYLNKHRKMEALVYSAYTFKSAKEIYQMLENDTLDDYLDQFNSDVNTFHAVAQYKKLYDKHYRVKQEIIEYVHAHPEIYKKLKSKDRLEIMQYVKNRWGELGMMLLSRIDKDEKIEDIILSQHYKISIWVNRQLKDYIKKIKSDINTLN
mgnify:FL=1